MDYPSFRWREKSNPLLDFYVDEKFTHQVIYFNTKSLPPPQAFRVSRKAGETGELEARETGDEHARDHGKEKIERRNACGNSVDFLAILSFSRHGTFPEFLSLSSDRF